MPNTSRFRGRRIRSVKNTQQIYPGDESYRGARLAAGAGNGRIAAAYAAGIREVLRSAMSRIENPTVSLLTQRPEERVLVLVAAESAACAGL